MIELIFSIEQYKFVCKYVPEIKRYEKNKSIENNVVKLFMEEQDFIEFQNDYNGSIVHYGMNNQDTVNEIGIELYKIFDECIY